MKRILIVFIVESTGHVTVSNKEELSCTSKYWLHSITQGQKYGGGGLKSP